MAISFVVAAIITCVLLLGVISVHETAFVKNNKPFIRIRLARVLSVLVRTEVLIAILVVVLAGLISAIVIFSVMNVLPIYHHLYQWQEFLTSDVAANGLLGIIFGGFLATWIARNYNRPPDSQLTFLQKVEGAAIILLFIVGTTSISFEELIRAIRVDEGKFGFQLAAPATRSTSGQEASGVQPNKKSNGNSNSTDTSFLDGFSLVQGTARAMQNDENYISAFLHKFTRENQNTNDKTIRKKLETAELQIERHRRNKESFTNSFQPLIGCIAVAINKTKDRSYLFSRLVPLRPLIGAIYINLIALDEYKTKDQTNRTVAKNIKEARKRLEDVVKKFNTSFGEESITYDVVSSVRTFGSTYHGLKEECGGLSSSGLVLSENLENSSVTLRPYLATIYAALLYMDNQKVEAIRFLNEAASKLKSDNLDTTDPQFWYLHRAIINLIFMTEDFFESETQSPTLQMREMHLSNLNLYLELLEKIDRRLPFRSIFDNHEVGGSELTLVETGFSRDPGFSKECPAEDDVPDMVLPILRYGVFSYLYFSIQAIYVERSLDHPNFNDKYGKITGHFAETVANIDLKCAVEIIDFPAEIVRYQRANFLYIYALHQEKLIQSKKNIGASHTNWLRARLDLIENSSKLASEVLDRNGSDDSEKILEDWGFKDAQVELNGDLQSLLSRTQNYTNLLR